MNVHRRLIPEGAPPRITEHDHVACAGSGRWKTMRRGSAPSQRPGGSCFLLLPLETIAITYNGGRRPGGETRRGDETPGCREARPELSARSTLDGPPAPRCSDPRLVVGVAARATSMLTITRDGMNAGGMTCHGARSHGRGRPCAMLYPTA